MQEQELLDLLKDMSLDEKINQMVQLNADFYDIEENGDSHHRTNAGNGIN